MKKSIRIIKDIGRVIFVENPRNKNINLSFHPIKGIRISYPPGTDYKALEDIIYRHQDQLKALTAQYTDQNKDQNKKKDNNNDKVKEQKAAIIIKKREASRQITQRMNFLSDKYNLPYNKLSFRNQKTRWGSCSYQNNISINIQLILLPSKFQDYILLHELVHTKIKNHSKDFWNELEKIMPGAQEYNRQLKLFHPKKIEFI